MVDEAKRLVAAGLQVNAKQRAGNLKDNRTFLIKRVSLCATKVVALGGSSRLIPILFDASELFAFVLYFMCIQAAPSASLLSQADEDGSVFERTIRKGGSLIRFSSSPPGLSLSFEGTIEDRLTWLSRGYFGDRKRSIYLSYLEIRVD